ncbi:hypothetical protein ACWDLG_05195 [Nonomuraea sp. NPDC003727]
MRLAHALVVLAASSASLFAVPAHAAPLPTYGCFDIQKRDGAAAVMAVYCESMNGAPTFGEITTAFRIVPNDSQENVTYVCRIPAGRMVSGYAGGYPGAILGFSCRERESLPADQRTTQLEQPQPLPLQPALVLDPIRVFLR